MRTAFQTRYPAATDVTWSPYKQYDRINWEWTGWPSMDTTYYAVNYTVDNRKHWGWWDRNMTWIGSTSTIEDSTMLPDPVKKTLQKSYSGYRTNTMIFGIRLKRSHNPYKKKTGCRAQPVDRTYWLSERI